MEAKINKRLFMNRVPKKVPHSFLTVKFDPCNFNFLYTIRD